MTYLSNTAYHFKNLSGNNKANYMLQEGPHVRFTGYERTTKLKQLSHKI